MSGVVDSMFASNMGGLKPGKCPSSTVEISVSARNLKDVDIFSKSDPVCYLFVKDGVGDWHEFGQTEPIMNNLNPDFVKKFNVDYYFGERQYIKFEIYDIDDRADKTKIKRGTFLGEYDCTLDRVVSCLKIEAPLTNSKSSKKVKGNIIVVCEVQSETKQDIHLQLETEELDLKKTFSKNRNPYLRISKETDSGQFIVVHRTETKRKEDNPKWSVSLSTRALCNGEDERLLRFEIYDDRNGDDKLLGETTTTLKEFKSVSPPISLQLTSPKKEKKQSENSGSIKIVNINFQTREDFCDYIFGGTQIKVTIGIDFGKTNGIHSSPSSLHHYTPGGPLNQYARAIQTVGEILEDYDSDKKFPCFGFGIKNPQSQNVDNLYALNGDPSQPECSGTEEVTHYYYSCLQRLELYGPSKFTPIINHVAKKAQLKTDGSQYHILLLLTDGILNDMAETKKEIIKAANLPVSIIIIGIGNGDFTAMKILDSDGSTPLVYHREKASRDIVQFVAFRDFDPMSMGPENVKNHNCLTREVLREVPEQLLSFMRSNEIKPGRSYRSSTLV